MDEPGDSSSYTCQLSMKPAIVVPCSCSFARCPLPVCQYLQRLLPDLASHRPATSASMGKLAGKDGSNSAQQASQRQSSRRALSLGRVSDQPRWCAGHLVSS